MKDCRGKTVKEGDTLKVLDDGFLCLKKGETKKVRCTNYHKEFYIECRQGKHFLTPQMDSKDKLVGLEKV